MDAPPELSERDRREWVWLQKEVEMAAQLSDQERVRVIHRLLALVDAINRTKPVDQLRREDEVRRQLDGEGLARYAALAERLDRP